MDYKLISTCLQMLLPLCMLGMLAQATANRNLLQNPSSRLSVTNLKEAPGQRIDVREGKDDPEKNNGGIAGRKVVGAAVTGLVFPVPCAVTQFIPFPCTHSTHPNPQITEFCQCRVVTPSA
eukprot:TRINITY_DN12696_c0_g1_i1.p1 TRINITY_DN12696_c0_g1~~TRINITY_DN12696_c0_g1_i1.p1  ORF type:complete len:121 (+),score=21.89 TRINITY_DN12696_c0_g1_i1:385-747(+)